MFCAVICTMVSTVTGPLAEMCRLHTHPSVHADRQNVLDLQTDSGSFAHKKLRSQTDMDCIPTNYTFYNQAFLLV